MEYLRQFATYLREEPPTRVCSVAASSYNESVVHHRNDSLVLYNPSKIHPKFEIVLLRSSKDAASDVYSLCRCDSIEAAEINFIKLADKVPVLYHISNDTSIQFLQKVCDVANAHPTWNIAHIGVELNLVDCIQNEKVIDSFHCEDTHDGLSPLQLAVRSQNQKIIQLLLSNGAPVDHFDHENCSTLHYAAQTNKKIVTMICEKSKGTLNSKNAKGQTPLHVACATNKIDCVATLLEAGADVNITTEELARCEPANIGDTMQLFPKKLHEEDIKFGGTPLHWACSREVIKALIDRKCNIDCLNFDRRTALHMMVLRGRLDCAIQLMCLGADLTIFDKDGRTALRMAVHQKDLNMVKALIAFDADVYELDSNNNTLRHGIPCGSSPSDDILYALHSVGAPRCAGDVRQCTPACRASDHYNGVPPREVVGPQPRDTLNLLLADATSQRNDFSKGRLLSLDGGGIRGLIIIMVLMELEKLVRKPIIHCFDWIAGTSTGGILALALASGKTLKECLKLYFSLKDDLFVGMRPYNSELLENILKESLGEDTTMSNIPFPKIMIPATLIDRKPVELHLFRNYPAPAALLEIPHIGPFVEPQPPPMQRLWEAARATGAAPSYFCAKDNFVDGGLISNNPAMDAITEIHEYNTAASAVNRHQDVTPLSLVVSIGTGVIPRVQNEGNGLNLLRLETLWQPMKWTGIINVINVLVDQATQADGRVVDRTRAVCSMIGVPFFRFSPQLSEDIQLDEVKNEKLVNMMWETRAYMHSSIKNLDELIEVLKSNVVTNAEDARVPPRF